MARGKKCPVSGCGMPMFAEKEENQETGRWVTYLCPNKSHPPFREKVFEDYKW
jgi:hypothetical protein